MFTYIIFDVDGTLIDTEQSILQSLQAVLRAEGREYTTDELKFALGIPGKEALEKLQIPDMERVHENWSRAMLEFSEEVRLFQGTEEVIERLAKSSLRLGIVTSKTRQEVEEEFNPFGLSHYFDCIVSASDTERHKPFPEPLLLCLETLGAKKSDALYIGDSIYDMKCAQSAGVPFALALWGSKTTEQFENADYLLSEPKDVLDLLEL